MIPEINYFLVSYEGINAKSFTHGTSKPNGGKGRMWFCLFKTV